jgi:hypothetical protein
VWLRRYMLGLKTPVCTEIVMVTALPFQGEGNEG